MHKEEELYKKVEGHLKEGEIELLKSLVEEVNYFNTHYASNNIELYVDFDNVGYECECDPYETFQLYVYSLTNQSYEIVTSGLSLHDLDIAICVLAEYFHESKGLLKPIEDYHNQMNSKILKWYEEAKKENKVLYKTATGTKTQNLDDVNQTFIDNILDDMHRLPKTIIDHKNETITSSSQHWVNDLALVELLKFYHDKSKELEAKLKIAEEKRILNEIIK